MLHAACCRAPQCPPPPAVTHVHSTALQQVINLLQLPCATAHPLVLDLGGRVLTGPLREPLHRQLGPQRGDAPVPGIDIILRRPCTLRNGTVHLPAGTHICVEAPGCQFEDLVITGQGTATAGGTTTDDMFGRIIRIFTCLCRHAFMHEHKK